MPWVEQDTMTLRQEFIKLALQKKSNISHLCDRFGISRKTGYKWIARYKEEGETGLINKTTKPLSSPNVISQSSVKMITQIRLKYPDWGARKIHMVLKRKGAKDIPSPSSITRHLQRLGHIKKRGPNRSTWQRFEHEAPNQLWQMDFKGHFEYEQGRCFPLTILDDHSRFSIALKACKNEQGKTIKPLLIQVFRQYGLPERINVDNGNPWGSPLANARFTVFSVWLISLGVQVSHSRPGHPQTNGKDERFHRTLKEELLKYHYFRNIKHIQRHFDKWRDIYNLERPHEAINMQVPSDRYQLSYRQYNERIEPYEYASDYELRKVDSRGRISYQSRQIFVGIPFGNQIAGIRNTSKDGEKQIYFRHQILGTIDLGKVPKSSIINLYSKRVTQL